MINKGYKNNQAVSVINKVQGVDGSLPISADNTPMYIGESPSDSGSCNFGTDRIGQKGRCLLFNATSRIDVIANNGDISSVSAIDETNAIVSLTPTFVTDRYQITGVDGNKYWNIKCWANGVTPTDEQKRATTLDESVETDLYTWWKCEDATGTTTLIKAYLGGVNGIIINPYLGFHATDVNIPYSYLNEAGYTLSDGMSFYYDSAATQLIPSGVFIPRDESSRTKCVAYTAVSVQVDLQYIGRCPSQAEYVESPCFRGNGSRTDRVVISRSKIGAHRGSCSVILEDSVGTNQYILSIDSSLSFAVSSSDFDGFCIRRSGALFQIVYEYNKSIDISNGGIEYGKLYNLEWEVDANGLMAYFRTNGVIVANNLQLIYDTDQRTIINGHVFNSNESRAVGGIGQRIFNVQFEQLGGTPIYNYPLLEPIKDAANHTYHDVVGGNHATLVNGSLANEGKQDVFHYGELGYNDRIILDTNSRDWLGGNSPTGWTIRDTTTTVINGILSMSPTSPTVTRMQLWYSDVPLSGLGISYKCIVRAKGVVGETLRVFLLGDTVQQFFTTGEFEMFEFVGDLPPAFLARLYIQNDEADSGTMEIDYIDFYEIGDHQIPASAVNPTEDALGNPLTVAQDGKSFLGTCKLKHVEIARAVQADTGFWFTPTGIANTKELSDFTGVIGDQLFSDVSESGRTRNIRTHKEALKSKQLVTEKKITKNL